jgi:hypothetical protein
MGVVKRKSGSPPGKLDLAKVNYEKAVDVGTKRGDPNVPAFPGVEKKMASR